MKKNKILCFVLILSMAFVFPLYANAYDYLDNDVVIDYLPGDVDENYSVTAADARLCLRAAAQLETLSEKQLKAVDFDGTGEINSATARQILRASAKLETITLTVNLNVGQRFVVGPLKAPTGREWMYKLNKENKFDVEVVTHNASGDKVGSAPHKYICFTTEETGNYTVNFEQQMGWNKKVYKDFNVLLNVS